MSNPASFVFYFPEAQPLNAVNLLMPGAVLKFFQSGTLIPAPIYSNATLTNQLNPVNVVSDGTGTFPTVYCDSTIAYRIQLYDNSVPIPNLLKDIDPINVPGTVLTAIPPASVLGNPSTAITAVSSIPAIADGQILVRQNGQLIWTTNLTKPISLTGQIVVGAPTVGNPTTLVVNSVSGGAPIVANGSASAYAIQAFNGATSPSLGLFAQAGTNVSDGPLLLNTANGSAVLSVNGFGSAFFTPTASAGTAVTITNVAGQDALDFNVNQSAGVGWVINISGTSATDLRGIQIINPNAGSAAGTVGLVIGNNGNNELLIGKTGTAYATNKFSGGPTGEVSYVWSGGNVPLILAYGTGGSPQSGVIISSNPLSAGSLLNLPLPGSQVSIQTSTGVPAFQAASTAATQCISLRMAQAGQATWQFYQPAGVSDFRLYNTTTGDTLIATSSGNITTVAPNSGTGLTVNGAIGNQALSVLGSGTTSQSFGLNVNAGSNASDWALSVQNSALTVNLAKLRGDGSFFLGWNGTANVITSTAGGNVTIAGSASGNTLTVGGASGGTPLILNPSSGSAGLAISNGGATTQAFSLGSNYATTGAQTATFTATNKPGSGTTTPSQWLSILVNGTQYYIPCWQ